jgi:dephospho-CoA kinase
MAMSKKVLVFVGMPGAGKSSCVKYLNEQGVPSVYFGGVVVNETKRRHGTTNESLEKQVREELRAKEGVHAIAVRIIKEIDELLQNQDRVVADGMYSWSEYKLFKEHYGNDAIIIAIAAPRHLRHERLAERPVRPLTEEEVTSREYAEIENIEKGGPIANADYTIVNDDTPETMLTSLVKILKETKFL